MHGCMSLMNEKYEEAETFLEAATCAESKNVIAWTMLGKYVIILRSSLVNLKSFEKRKELSFCKLE